MNSAQQKNGIGLLPIHPDDASINSKVRFEALPEAIRNLYFKSPAAHLMVWAFTHDRIPEEQLYREIACFLAVENEQLRTIHLRMSEIMGLPAFAPK